MDTQKCGFCDDFMSDGVHCTVCNKDMHYHCVGVTETGYRRLGDKRLSTWRCPKCKQTGSSVQTPSSPRSPVPDSDTIMLLEIRALAAKIGPLEGLKEEILALKNEFADLKSSVNTQLNNIFSELSTKIQAMEQRVMQIDKVQTQVEQLQEQLTRLEEDSHDRDQWSRLNNVEFKGIPQTSNENLFDIVSRIGEKINYPITKTQINFVTRVPTREKDNIKPIILSFSNRYVKEDFISAAKYRSKTTALTCGEIGFTGNRRVFINDHLTPRNKLLLSKAKKAAKEKDFRYIWVKQAKIYARKMDTSPIILVKSEKDLTKIV